MFPVTITIKNATQLNAVMAILDPDNNEYARQKAIESEPKAEFVGERVQLAKADPKPAAAAKSATPPEQSAPAATTADSSSEAHATYEQAAQAITALSRAKGRDAAVAVLSQFGASKLPDVKPDQFAAVVAAAEKAMA
jgi:hypothetical protein